jgi:hypothetical protein
VHRTLHCALSGAPAARAQDLLLLCVVRWFTRQLLCAVRCAPDRHCRLSGAPISRFKKRPPARDRARGSLFPLCSLLSALSGDFPLLTSDPHRRCAPVTSPAWAPLPPPLGEQPYLPLTFPSLFFCCVVSLYSTPWVPNSNSYHFL